jgi:CRP-like cAMP-binding protein
MDCSPLNLFTENIDAEHYDRNAAVFARGETAAHRHVIKRGNIELSVDGKVLSMFGTGDRFVEMALISPHPRSATAGVVRDSELVPVDQKRFTFTVQHTPCFALHVMRVLADRLRQTSEWPARRRTSGSPAGRCSAPTRPVSGSLPPRSAGRRN